METEQVRSCRRIEEVPVWNLGAESIIITKAFHSFFSFPSCKCWDSSLSLTMTSRMLPTTLFPVDFYSCVDYVTCIRTYVTAHSNGCTLNMDVRPVSVE